MSKIRIYEGLNNLTQSFHRIKNTGLTPDDTIEQQDNCLSPCDVIDE